MPNIEEVGQLVLSYIAGGSVKWYNHFGELFCTFLKSEIYIYPRTQHLHPEYLPKRIENLYPQKDLYKNIRSVFIHSS